MSALTPIVPAFDADSPDAHILGSFEKLRSGRAAIYAYDDAPAGDITADVVEMLQNDADAEMAGVEENVAVTLPGVIARLTLLVPSLDNQRWADRLLVEGGFLALYRRIKDLDGHAQQAMYAAHDLIDIDWCQALAAYEQRAADFDLALKLRSLVDAEAYRRREAGEPADAFIDALDALAVDQENRFSNDQSIHSLLRTLAPDHAAYLRKCEIAVTEGLQADAMPWLARDTHHLVGGAEPAASGERN